MRWPAAHRSWRHRSWRYRSSRHRSSRYRATAAFVVAELVLTLAVPFLAIAGYHALLDSRAGRFVEQPGISQPGWRALVDPTPVTAVVELTGDQITGIALVAGATVVLVPGELVVDGEPLAARTGPDAATALSSALRLRIAATEVLDAERWRARIDAAGAGDGSQVVDLPLRPTASGPEADPAGAEALIRQVVPFPAGPVPGARIQVRVLDRTGTADLPSIAAAVAATGVEVVEIGNAAIFDGGPTHLIVPAGLDDPGLIELAGLTGAATVEDAENGSEAAATLLVGSDFALAKPEESRSEPRSAN